jgi:hypothetical protein
MEVLKDISFELDATALMEKAHVEPGGDDAAEFRQLMEAARAVARPKALFMECFIEAKGDTTVTVNGITFTSAVLRRNLDKVERVFPYIATCGCELDRVPLPTGDYLKEFWLDTIKMAVLGAARDHLNQHLARRFALTKASNMNPGSGDATVWPIEQQKELFALLGDVKNAIGVELTDSFLMTPKKTVSGIRFPTEVDFRSCQLCHRADCPSRAAPLDPALVDSMQHE